MSQRKSTTLGAVAACAVLGAGLFVAVGPAQAVNGFLSDWSALYPESRSGQAGCLLCHGKNSSVLNPYGKDLCVQLGGVIPKDVKVYLQALESLDSDGEASANLTEIRAHAQPGWTMLTPLYYSEGCASANASIAPPSGVPLPYDPPVGGLPVAVPGGPYSALVGVPIAFDATGSYDSDGGTIQSYAWDFGDGTSSTFPLVQKSYSATGTYTVTLTVVDNANKSSSNQTTATVSPGTALDLDIASLSITKSVRVGKPIAIKLTVENKGAVLGQALATIVGTMDGVEVYRWRMNVFDDLSKGGTTFTYPSHTPAAAGTIAWTAVIDDADPDADTATATTVVSAK